MVVGLVGVLNTYQKLSLPVCAILRNVFVYKNVNVPKSGEIGASAKINGHSKPI